MMMKVKQPSRTHGNNLSRALSPDLDSLLLISCALIFMMWMAAMLGRC